MGGARRGLAAVAGVLIVLAAPVARADNPPPPPEDPPPHVADDSCTVGLEESWDVECLECEIDHPTSNADYEACQRELAPWGFDLACGDLWREVFCRDRNAGYGDPPGGGDADDGDTSAEGCSITGRGSQSVPVQVGLALVIVSLGLLALRRVR